MAEVRPGAGAACPGCGIALLMAEPPPLILADRKATPAVVSSPPASPSVMVILGVLLTLVVFVMVVGRKDLEGSAGAVLAVLGGLAMFLLWKVLWAWIMFPIHVAQRQERIISLLEQIRRP